MNRHGGHREGAGRPKIGKSRPLRITLPEEGWSRIDKLIEEGRIKTTGEYFRLAHKSFDIQKRIKHESETVEKWLKLLSEQVSKYNNDLRSLDNIYIGLMDAVLSTDDQDIVVLNRAKALNEAYRQLYENLKKGS